MFSSRDFVVAEKTDIWNRVHHPISGTSDRIRYDRRIDFMILGGLTEHEHVIRRRKLERHFLEALFGEGFICRAQAVLISAAMYGRTLPTRFRSRSPLPHGPRFPSGEHFASEIALRCEFGRVISTSVKHLMVDSTCHSTSVENGSFSRSAPWVVFREVCVTPGNSGLIYGPVLGIIDRWLDRIPRAVIVVWDSSAITVA